jgi:hypothetical protein
MIFKMSGVFQKLSFSTFLPPLGRFGRPFWARSILKGVPKSDLFERKQHKGRQSGVREGASKKHRIPMRNPREKVTFQET